MRFEKVLKHGCSCFILSNLSLSRSLSAIFGYPPTTPCNLICTTCPYFSSYTVFVLLINLTSRRIAKSLNWQFIHLLSYMPCDQITSPRNIGTIQNFFLGVKGCEYGL